MTATPPLGEWVATVEGRPHQSKKGRPLRGGPLLWCRLIRERGYSRSERFQLMRSPSVVLLEEDEEEEEPDEPLGDRSRSL
jgi:hypothetical protein